ncbi:MAG: hypothetical protein RL885_06145 [Planctomycetota bacterium]
MPIPEDRAHGAPGLRERHHSLPPAGRIAGLDRRVAGQDAEDTLPAIRRILEATIDGDHAHAHVRDASARRELPVKAPDLLLPAIEVLQKRFGPKAPPVREALRALATLYETKGDTAKAAEYRQLLKK